MAEVSLKLKSWQVPNFATLDTGPARCEDGMKEPISIPVSELSRDALNGLAGEWLSQPYRKAGQDLAWRCEG